MKKVTTFSFLLVLFLLFTGFGYAQKNSKWLKVGTKMSYIVNEDYDFVVIVKKLKKGVEFDWRMRQGSSRGNVKMTPEALKDATAQNNYFYNGDDVYKDKTSVWVSKKVYQALKDKTAVQIQPSGVVETLNFIAEETIKVKIDGVETELKVLHGRTDRGSEFWILDDPKAPVILRMIIDFEIRITEISTK